MSSTALIGVPGTDELEWTAMRLEERGVQVVILDARADPAIEIGPRHVTVQGHDLGRLRSVFVRDLGLPSPTVVGRDGTLDPEASLAALGASRRRLSAWNVLLEVLIARGVRVVNPPATHELHALKPLESALHAAAGMPVPAALATSDPEALAAPPPSSSGTWIEKGLLGGRGYTETFDPGSLRDTPVDAALSARLVQEYIEGDNIRAYVVGMRCIGAAAIFSEDGHETDSRRGNARVLKLALPAEAADRAVEATRLLGMLFSAVDFMREASTGRFVLLECNSSPFFVNFETTTGIPVTSLLADFLVSKGPHFLRSAQAAKDKEPASPPSARVESKA